MSAAILTGFIEKSETEKETPLNILLIGMPGCGNDPCIQAIAEQIAFIQY